jgi:hypothetical protein
MVGPIADLVKGEQVMAGLSKNWWLTADGDQSEGRRPFAGRLATAGCARANGSNGVETCRVLSARKLVELK